MRHCLIALVWFGFGRTALQGFLGKPRSRGLWHHLASLCGTRGGNGQRESWLANPA